MPAITAEGIVLRVTDFSETSRIVALYTREHGRLDGLAKGAKRERSRFWATLDLGFRIRVGCIPGPRGGLATLTDCALVDAHLGLRGRLDAIYAAFAVIGLLREVGRENDPDPALYDEAAVALARLRSGMDPLLSTVAFEARALATLGVAPVTERCVGCEAPLGPGGAVPFRSLAGGTLCGTCAREQGAGALLSLSRPGLAALGALASGRLTRLDRMSLPGRVSVELARVLEDYVSHTVERPFRLNREVIRWA